MNIELNNYKFISLGNNCSIKYNLDLYMGKKETLFFDWIITDFITVNQILSCKNIDDIINHNNIKRVGGNSHKKTSKVSITSVNKCLSIHDLPLKYNKEDINDFIKKYKRRYFKIINMIKHSKLKLYFLIHGNITEYEACFFINNIKKININCDFKLICLSYNNLSFNIINFLYINLRNYEIGNKPILLEDYWKGELWNWNDIFNFIVKN